MKYLWFPKDFLKILVEVLGYSQPNGFAPFGISSEDSNVRGNHCLSLRKDSEKCGWSTTQHDRFLQPSMTPSRVQQLMDCQTFFSLFCMKDYMETSCIRQLNFPKIMLIGQSLQFRTFIWMMNVINPFMIDVWVKGRTVI